MSVVKPLALKTKSGAFEPGFVYSCRSFYGCKIIKNAV